jgi:hypothetical protein
MGFMTVKALCGAGFGPITATTTDRADIQTSDFLSDIQDPCISDLSVARG